MSFEDGKTEAAEEPAQSRISLLFCVNHSNLSRYSQVCVIIFPKSWYPSGLGIIWVGRADAAALDAHCHAHHTPKVFQWHM